MVHPNRLRRVLQTMLDETSSYRRTAFAAFRGITRTTRSCCGPMDAEYRVDYEPAESSTGLFGGNSNWRGPVWFP
jgi:hypothetical protein